MQRNECRLRPGDRARSRVAEQQASEGVTLASLPGCRILLHYAHEGGVSTPFIVHWPRGLKKQGLVNTIGHEIDIMPTCLEVAGVNLPEKNKVGTALRPLEGKSLLPVFEGRELVERSLFWEHEGNSAVRKGKWKLVSRFPDSWELYDMEQDRTEMRDLADQHPDRVKAMASDYASWAKRVGVQRWPMPETPAGPIREGAMTSPEYLRNDRLAD